MPHIRLSTGGVAKSRLRTRRYFATTALYCLAIIIFIVGLVFVARSSIFSLGQVEVLGAEHVGVGEIESASRSLLESHYLGFVPKSHRLFYPEDALASALLAQFPRIAKVETSAGNGALKLVVTEYTENYVWCGTECFYMNEQGELFASAATTSNLITFRRPDYSEGGIGKVVFTQDFLANTLGLLELFSVGGFDVSSVSLVGEDVTVTFRQGLELRYLLADSYQAVYDKTLRVLGMEDLADKSLEEILYIDLRFGSKVYYKIRQ